VESVKRFSGRAKYTRKENPGDAQKNAERHSLRGFNRQKRGKHEITKNQQGTGREIFKEL
jgi:hypothetical protein